MAIPSLWSLARLAKSCSAEGPCPPLPPPVAGSLRCAPLKPGADGIHWRRQIGAASAANPTGGNQAMRTMKITSALLALAAAIVVTGTAFAQDLGPRVKKLADGVYVHTGNGFDSNSGIILTDEGVVVIDTGQNPIESRDIAATVKKLTAMPVRRVMHPEPHADHTTGHFVFPQAIIVAAAGGGESMRAADRAAPNRIQT